ncbi:MAG: pyruvate kinase [Sphaerochaeta sp.]|uniref:pyruvate kinase n=1 Tax=Sphaerochaeta sp. TaxID=1972642 RepID=UPI002FC69C36
MTYTKIVATLGPASESYALIKAILEAGCRVFRLNFSHGTHEEQQARYDLVCKASKELAIPVAVFLDLQGPKIRLGQLEENSYTLHKGEELIITTQTVVGNRKRVSIDYAYLHEEIEVGQKILINDGLVSLVVDRIEGQDIHCRMLEDGTIAPRKGVNLPTVPLHHLSSFTPKDADDLAFAFKNNLEYVALSFVRSSKDVKALKDHMQTTYGRTIPIISKIEKPQAVANLKAIMAESSAIMIARGDLGVEVPAEEVPLIQKSIIKTCIDAGLPVITATQMLESMIHNPRPTRAETNDVANAVLDGTSAVMLSGETAAGEYPLQAVQTMCRIANLVEKSDAFRNQVFDQISTLDPTRKQTKTEAVGMATRELALSVGASYIACFTQSGSTARLIAKFRPSVPIIAFSPLEEVVRYLALSWGVTPILIGQQDSVDQLLSYAPAYLAEHGLVHAGDTVVITAGVPVGSSGKTNMIKVVEIE